MKKLYLLLLFMLIPSIGYPAEAVKSYLGVSDSSVKTVTGVATASVKGYQGIDWDDGDATTYIYSGGTSSTAGVTGGYSYFSIITGENQTLTSIGFNLYSKGSATACRIALWDDTDGNRTFNGTSLASGTIASPADGWNDLTGLSVAMSSGKYYWVGIRCNNDDAQAGTNASSSAGGFKEEAYAADWPTTKTACDASGEKYLGRVGY